MKTKAFTSFTWLRLNMGNREGQLVELRIACNTCYTGCPWHFTSEHICQLNHGLTVPSFLLCREIEEQCLTIHFFLASQFSMQRITAGKITSVLHNVFHLFSQLEDTLSQLSVPWSHSYESITVKMIEPCKIRPNTHLQATPAYVLY